MANQSKHDQIIGHAANMQAAGEGGWPCGMMFFVGLLFLAAFVVLPAMMGA